MSEWIWYKRNGILCYDSNLAYLSIAEQRRHWLRGLQAGKALHVLIDDDNGRHILFNVPATVVIFLFDILLQSWEIQWSSSNGIYLKA